MAKSKQSGHEKQWRRERLHSRARTRTPLKQLRVKLRRRLANKTLGLPQSLISLAARAVKLIMVLSFLLALSLSPALSQFAKRYRNIFARGSEDHNL